MQLPPNMPPSRPASQTTPLPSTVPLDLDEVHRPSPPPVLAPSDQALEALSTLIALLSLRRETIAPPLFVPPAEAWP